MPDLLACYGQFGRLGMELPLGMRTCPCRNLNPPLDSLHIFFGPRPSCL